jgi:hypothetical protein
VEAGKFDALVKQVSSMRSSRRNAIAAIASGIAAAAVGSSTNAQDATPVAESESDNQEFLFVQMADTGAWIPSPDEDDVFLLTLAGTGNQTMFFSDRPQRILGTVPTERLFDVLSFTPENAPNAAIVTHDETGARDVLVVELFDPILTQSLGDDPSTTVTYKARMLNSDAASNLQEWQFAQQDDQLDPTFTDVSLYIEDCVQLIWCNRDYHSWGPVPGGPISLCWNQHELDCFPCNGGQIQDYHDACNREYLDCIDACEADVAYYR